MKLFDFKLWPKSFSGEARKWGCDEIRNVTAYYVDNAFLTEQEMELCIRQWPMFRHRVARLRLNKIFDVYTDLLKEKDEDMKGMLILLELMLTFSASTAACERGFSSMNMSKTKLRTGLNLKTLDSLMRISIDGPKIENFDAEKFVACWNKKAIKKRHLEHGHKTDVKKAKLS